MKTKKHKTTNVTVLIEVYNEEQRIESCLRSFMWADEIILFDKNSTDNTREIAKPYATEIILVPYCEGSENYINNIINRKTKEWCLFPTASSLMHPSLADRIIALTSQNNFPYDVIGIPYAMFSFGIRSSYSPFFATHKHTLIRRKTLELSTKLHNEISSTSSKIFDIQVKTESESLYHCTHKNADSFWDHVIRYAKYESQNDTDLTTKKAGLDIFKAIYLVIIRRRTFLLGKDGVALSLGYLSYFIARFIFIWDKKRENKGEDIYKNTRDYINNLWNERNKLDDEK